MVATLSRDLPGLEAPREDQDNPHLMDDKRGSDNEISTSMSRDNAALQCSNHSRFQLIIDALADYANQTGIDPSQNPFAEKLQQSDRPDDILTLLQERENAFKEHRDGYRRLINCLSPVVRVLHVFSGTLGEAISLVSYASFVPLFLH
jgi:fungal STAND N-terminal Goodbye domain